MQRDPIKTLKWIYFFKSLWFFAPILTLFYLSRNLTLFEIVTLEAILTAATILAEVPTGLYADKYGRKNVLFWVTGLYILGNLIIIYSHSYVPIAAAQVLFGIALAFGSGAVEAYVYDHLAATKRQKEMSKVWGALTAYSLVAGVLAVLIGGYLARSGTAESYVLLLWLYQIGACIAFALVFFLTEDKKTKSSAHDNPFIALRSSFHDVIANAPLRGIFVLSLLTFPFYHILKFLIQPYFTGVGVPIGWFGVVIAIAWSLQALMSANAHRIEKRFGMKRTIFLATIMPGVLYLLLALVMHQAIAILGYILFNGFCYLRDPLFSQYINDHIAAHNRATILSALSIVVSIYIVIMQFIIGAVAEVDIRYAYILMGVIISIGAFMLRIDEKHLNHSSV